MESKLGSRIEAYKLKYTRIMCISCAFLYPFVGHLLLLIDDSSTEFLGHRYLIGFSLLILFISTYLSAFFKKNAMSLLNIILTIGVLWIVWIVAINNFSTNYSVMMIAAIGATATVFLDRRVLVLFLLLVTIVLFFSVSQDHSFDLSKYAAVLACATLGIVVLINSMYKDNIKNEISELNQKLGRYNSDLEQEVEERTKLLKQKNIELENYTYLVSHDLKSPLTNAISFANLIGKDLKNKNYDDLNHHITIINQSVNRMSSILSDLLIHGKIGLTETISEKIDLHKLIEQLINSNFKSQIDNGAVIEIDSKLPKMISADKQQLSLLLQNLISNGLKYNTSKQKKVKISGRKLKDEITITILDNGIGFASKESNKIFDMFRRLHTKDDYEGTGLGLAICKRVVDNHRGTITASSMLDAGSKFEFTI